MAIFDGLPKERLLIPAAVRALRTLRLVEYRCRQRVSELLDLLLELGHAGEHGSLEQALQNMVLLWSRKTRQQLGMAQLDATLSERSANCVRGVHQAQAFVEGGPTPTKAPCRIVPIAL